MLQNAMLLNSQDLSEPLKCISIYSYLLSIGKTNNSAISCNTNSSAQPV